MDNLENVQKTAYKNYKNSEPWPPNDEWHNATQTIINQKVSSWINKYITEDSTCLNIGAGKTNYSMKGKLIQMDIIEEYAERYTDYIIGSVECIPLQDESIDFVICVGSVLNYCDAIRSICEINRVLKPNGRAIIEFERSNSAEFLFTKKYSLNLFLKNYYYNNQNHFLWMYSEKYIKYIFFHYNLNIESIYRFHILSSLMYRLGLNIKKSSKYSKYDNIIQILSYPFAHNTIIEIIK